MFLRRNFCSQLRVNFLKTIDHIREDSMRLKYLPEELLTLDAEQTNNHIVANAFFKNTENLIV